MIVKVLAILFIAVFFFLLGWATGKRYMRIIADKMSRLLWKTHND